MGLIDGIEAGQQARVRERLDQNVIAWFTSVRPNGQPELLPVWFLWRDDETVLIYSQPGSRKLENIAQNNRVALALDVSDFGRSLVRITGTAAVSSGEPAAATNGPYLAKYMERIAALFGTPKQFSEMFSVAVVVTSKRLMTG